MKKTKPILNKKQISGLGKYLQSEEWRQKLIEIQKQPVTHTCSYPSNKKCCIDWWNSIKDVPFNI